jgi:ATP-dependent DNA helicase MPH1
MNQMRADCEERFKEVLDREAKLSFEESLLSSKRATAERRLSSANPGRKLNAPQFLPGNSGDNDSDVDFPSPSKLFSDILGHQQPKPFQPPRKVSRIEDDFNFPDPTALLTPDAERRDHLKRRRIVLDNDSDE